MWYNALNILANNDITKHEAVLNLPLIHCLNHLIYLMEIKNKKNG